MLIRKLRLQRGWAQEQLAELCDFSVRTIQRLEKGDSLARKHTNRSLRYLKLTSRSCSSSEA